MSLFLIDFYSKRVKKSTFWGEIKSFISVFSPIELTKTKLDEVKSSGVFRLKDAVNLMLFEMHVSKPEQQKKDSQKAKDELFNNND